MAAHSLKPKRKSSLLRILLWVLGGFLGIIVIVFLFLYAYFNPLLSAALMKSFNSTAISNVYELKFDKLSVNLLEGNISVYSVDLAPREKPLRSYPYINTWFHLTTHKILLRNVEIYTLLKTNKLILDRVEIENPTVDLKVTDAIPILFPFEDTTAVSKHVDSTKNKKTIEGFHLKEFDLADADFHVTNSAKQREFSIKNLNIALNDMLIDQLPGRDLISYNHIRLSIGEATGKLMKESIKYVSFKDYTFSIDSIRMQKSVDTLIFHFSDLATGIKAVDIQTADSIFHVSMQSFGLSYKDKSIMLKGVSFKPNISEAAMQARYKFQNTQFSGSVGSLNITGINFDTLIYHKKLFIDEVMLDSVAFLFKDKTKPMDSSRFPEYLGQTVKAIPLPLQVKQVKATNVTLVNRERNADGSYATAHLNRATLGAKNISNITMSQPLTMNADAYIENKVRFALTLGFSYQKPEFTMNATLKKFNLLDLNTLIQAYSPAKINKGTVDEISLSGTATRTNSSGTMKFLYHDLEVDMELKNQAKWKSSVVAFAANTLVASSNPVPGEPPRVVEFHADRDMNKAFVNLVIKSLLGGLKETVVMSKENRKAHKEAIKKMKKESKK